MSEITLGEVVIVGGGCYGTFYARQLMAASDKGKAEFDRLLIVDQDPACQFARELGVSANRELVLEDWDNFFDRYLGGKAVALRTPDRRTARPRSSPLRSATLDSGPASPSGPDRPNVIVPSPLMPHLMYQWLLREARKRWPGRQVETVPLPVGPGTPYDRLHPDGTRYVSFADWLCPTHCVEPALCPVTRAPRTWEMSDAVIALTHWLGEERPVAGPVLFRCEHLVFGVGTFAVTDVLAGDTIVREAGAGGEPVDLPVATLSSCHGAVNLLHLGPI